MAHNDRNASKPSQVAEDHLLKAEDELRKGSYFEAIVETDRCLENLKSNRWNSMTHPLFNNIAARATYLAVLAEAMYGRNGNTAVFAARRLLEGFKLELLYETATPPLDPSKSVSIAWYDYTMPQRNIIIKLSKTPWWLMPRRRRYILQNFPTLLK